MILTEEDLIGGVQLLGVFGQFFAVEDESEMVTISGHQDARRNDEKNLLKALAHQSLGVAIDASARDFQMLWGRFGPWCYCSWVWIKQGFRLYHCEKFLGTNMEGGEKGYIGMNNWETGGVCGINKMLPSPPNRSGDIILSYMHLIIILISS
ncbi:unnamed protein product [Brassica rapa]|uniref:Uncharacterized protein n=1 Tax=Brassica campestris TaxID=3711 RepID=A0A8D9D6F3_BRACM|nr:unnamed protein product [Brassica rapa]